MLKLLQDHEPFLDQVFKELAAISLDVSTFALDHICYRVSTRKRYDYLRRELAWENELLAESIINQRPIANFVLNEPLTYKKRIIEILELPAPKPLSKYTEGYEHVEFVIHENLEKFRARYSHLSFDESGLNKERNQDLRIKFNNLSVKFHEQSLRNVIEKEQLNQ